MICLLAFLAALQIPRALAQDEAIQIEAVQIELPPGIRVPGLPPGAIPPNTAGTNASAKPQTPEEKRLQELLKLKFNRTASSILDALAGQLEGRTATNEVEQFRQIVVGGDWPAVGRFLSTLPPDHGKQVYRYLLRELPNASNPTRAAGGPDQPMPMPPQGGPSLPSGPTLVPADVLALAEIAPHDIEGEDMKLLGQLLARLLGRGDAVEPTLAKLEKGVKRLGGGDPADRRRAADLLVSADRLVEAGRFLQTLESAKESKDWETLDLHARQLLALGKKEQDSKALARAWEVNQLVLSSADIAATNREPALRRSFELMPLISRELGTNWLRNIFQNSPGQGLAILSSVSQMVQGGTERAVDQRQKNLDLQKQVVETFLSVADLTQPHWRSALNLLVQGWMREAAHSRQRHQPRRNYGPQYDQFGNMVYFDQSPQQFQDGNQLQPISVEEVLKSAPGDDWLKQTDESLRLALIGLIADLYLKTEQPDRALTYIEALAPAQPEIATERANEFLRAWARTRNPVQQPRQMYGPYGNVWYGPGSPYGMRGQGLSLTRAMQNRNIEELSGLLRRLEALRLARLSDDAVVGAFSGAHSPAEVFRTADIGAVFGPLEKMKLETLAGLTQTMRERLAGQWRQSRVQQEVKTQRTDKQIEAEVLRGYEVVLKLIEGGLERSRDHWELNLSRAAALFDLAEFQYGKKVDLAIYVEKREEAFKTFERSASFYAAALSGIEEKEQSPRVYQQWFNANLGASDLAYVTRQQEPETNQLQLIRAAILALPDQAAERHMAAFARSLGESVNTIPPQLKPRYLRAGLRVVGDHSDAAEARKLVTYYDDLLKEIELMVRLDGEAVVGHSRPFGVFVSLRHTADVEREAGGFARYLRNVKKGQYAMFNPYGQPQRNFIEEFEKQVREKLVDQFEIRTITFLDEKVQSRGYGRDGWRETPLAFLLLEAKDGSVDRLPALHMDLDFMDQRGAVVLPVESQITLVDARPDRVPSRPVADLEVTQILDDREINEGRLSLEIKAAGKGLVPELSGLLRTNFAGFAVDELTDHGLSIARIDTEGDALAPVSERNWLVKLRLPEDAPASLAFQFPPAAQENVKLTFKRYADADLVEVEPKVALTGLSLRPRPIWHWFLLAGGIAVVATGGLIVWMRRRKPEETAVVSPYLLPEPLTPFNVIGLLRRLHADAALRWTENDRLELAGTIQDLERYFFDRDRNGDPAPDLGCIGRRWVTLARNGH